MTYDIEQESSTTKHKQLKHGSDRRRLALGLSILSHYTLTTTTHAFSPVNDSNKKCQGLLSCRRRNILSAPIRDKSMSIHNNHANKKTGNSFAKDIESHNNNNNEGNSDNFAIRMMSHHIEEIQRLEEEEEEEISQIMEENESTTSDESPMSENLSSESMTIERRIFLGSLLASASTATGTLNPEPSAAYEKAFPVNLDFDGDDTSRNLQSIRQERIAVKKSQAKQTKADLVNQPLVVRNKQDLISSVAWGGALWLLLGSRSNPLVNPLANLVYDENSEEGKWVKDRNDGLFTPLPVAFMLLMGVCFFALGFITDRALLFISEEDSTAVLQLAGISLIGGASLELGRIASGEKMITRADMIRDTMLAEEFNEFASKRLIVGQGGSSVHKNEVIRSFRRFFAKYRVENDQYPLTDLEIERLLRTWNKIKGNEEGLTSAGFVKGVNINDQAEIR